MVYNINTIEIIIHCIHYISIINKSVIHIIITSNEIHCNIYRSTYTTFFHNYIKDFAKQRYNTPYACNVI